MRSYRTTDGRFVGTQAEAGAGASRIEIPDDKAGLLNFLNALVTAPRSDDEPAAIHKIAIRGGSLPHIEADDTSAWRRVKRTPLPHADAGKPDMITLTDAEEFIQAANAIQLRSLFENVVMRGRELLPEVAA